MLGRGAEKNVQWVRRFVGYVLNGHGAEKNVEWVCRFVGYILNDDTKEV